MAKMYVYHMPYMERKEVCHILDQNNKWEELAAVHMKYDCTTIQKLKREILRGNSPTEELLMLWGNQNHTVLELFFLLSRMEHYQAMNVLKKLVETKYHVLIKEKTLNSIMSCLQIGQNNNGERSEKILNVPVNHARNGAIPRISVQNYASNNVSVEDNAIVDRSNVRRERSPLLTPLGRIGISKILTDSDMSSVADTFGALPQIPYDDLKKSTNNWDPKTMLGRGGFGTVFRGVWKCTQVAVKRIEEKQNIPDAQQEQIKQSLTELHCLNAYRHDNILPLYGYSIGGPQPCLVYQYMSGGSLEHRLRVKDLEKVLKWSTRLNIAIGTARGLQYLHTIGDKPLIHGDIKSANILLDHNDTPRIGDFGLAREGPQSDYSHIKLSKIQGTEPYLPVEFLRSNQFSTKVDTYSFGVVLFEITTALGPRSNNRKDKFLKDHVVNYEENIFDLMDPRAPQGGEGIFKGLIDIGKKCVSKKSERPEMVSVLIQLEQVSV